MEEIRVTAILSKEPEAMRSRSQAFDAKMSVADLIDWARRAEVGGYVLAELRVNPP